MLKCVHTFMLGFSSFMTIEKVQHTGPPCKATIEDGSPLVAIVTQKDGWLDAYIACNASACRYSTGTGRFHVHTGPGLVHRSFSWWPASPWCLFSRRAFPTTLVAKCGQASLRGHLVCGQRSEALACAPTAGGWEMLQLLPSQPAYTLGDSTHM